jgi:hypothetical protein
MARTSKKIDAGAKREYPVLDEIRHDGETYSPKGDNSTIELTDAQAASLLAVKAIGEALSEKSGGAAQD